MIYPQLNLAIVPIELITDKTLTPEQVVICLHLFMTTFLPAEAESVKDMADHLGISEKEYLAQCEVLENKVFLHKDELHDRMADMLDITLELSEIF